MLWTKLVNMDAASGTRRAEYDTYAACSHGDTGVSTQIPVCLCVDDQYYGHMVDTLSFTPGFEFDIAHATINPIGRPKGGSPFVRAANMACADTAWRVYVEYIHFTDGDREMFVLTLPQPSCAHYHDSPMYMQKCATLHLF